MITPGILPCEGEFAEGDTRNAELADVGARTAAHRAAIANADVGDELRGSFCSFFCAAKNSSSVVVGIGENGLQLSALGGVLGDER